jgi:hypothetical protein
MFPSGRTSTAKITAKLVPGSPWNNKAYPPTSVKPQRAVSAAFTLVGENQIVGDLMYLGEDQDRIGCSIEARDGRAVEGDLLYYGSHGSTRTV